VRLSEFDFDLPHALIARVPAERREDARLLVLDRRSGTVSHDRISALPRWLQEGDVVVVNDVRVVRARLRARRATGGRVEVLVLRISGDTVSFLASHGRLRVGESLEVAESPRAALRILDRSDDVWTASVEGVDPAALLERLGHVPLPPYIRDARRRDGLDEAALEPLDRERYQTVFAAGGNAVAAPTAGLHLSGSLLESIEAAGARLARVRLEVGRGTFAPIRDEDPALHRMAPERYEVPEAAAAAIRAARRVVAVGTTVVRTLETVAAEPEGIRACEGETGLFIRPGFEFRAVHALLTNFHLPRSTLLLLVCAFAGTERVLAAYREAIRQRYRFYSYGDAMLIL
jgi:S-adenosylmethionine:tRNA ribosyltransferase-isomerase